MLKIKMPKIDDLLHKTGNVVGSVATIALGLAVTSVAILIVKNNFKELFRKPEHDHKVSIAILKESAPTSAGNKKKPSEKAKPVSDKKSEDKKSEDKKSGDEK